MFKKHDVRFPAEGGIELSAWLFVPEGHKQPLQPLPWRTDTPGRNTMASSPSRKLSQRLDSWCWCTIVAFS